MIWLILIGVLIGFAVNAIFIIAQEFKKHGLLYLCYIIGSILFLLYTYEKYNAYYDIFPDYLPDLERILQCAALIFYYLFLFYFLKPNYDYLRFRWLIIFQITSSAVVGPLASLLDNYNPDVAVYFILSISIISFLLNFYLAYLMLKNRSLYVNLIGGAFAFALLLVLASLFLFTNNHYSSLKTNPHTLYHIATIIEIVVFNYVLTRKQVENRISYENSITNLERSALQAQMNPHFIFNCLNSVQSYIMANQKDTAMEYLACFAKLIRQNLNASTENMIALDQEVSMLNNYIELEQMRFHDSFECSIELENIDDSQELYLPPMIVQPYLENAIIHGMKSKKGGGLIKIKFIKDKDQLKIKISDNGEGIQAKRLAKRKSYGMSITEKRLSHLAKQSGSNYQIDKTSSSEGTTIDIAIKLAKKV